MSSTYFVEPDAKLILKFPEFVLMFLGFKVAFFATPDKSEASGDKLRKYALETSHPSRRGRAGLWLVIQLSGQTGKLPGTWGSSIPSQGSLFIVVLFILHMWVCGVFYVFCLVMTSLRAQVATYNEFKFDFQKSVSLKRSLGPCHEASPPAPFHGFPSPPPGLHSSFSSSLSSHLGLPCMETPFVTVTVLEKLKEPVCCCPHPNNDHSQLSDSFLNGSFTLAVC